MNHSNSAILQVMLLGVVASITAASQQAGSPGAIPVRIDPPKATVYIGETQAFTALVDDAKSCTINWSIHEAHGGHITREGVYTAPRDIGIYHIEASCKTDARAKAIATVTIVQNSDPPTDFK
jgi:hypothetical protein